MRVGIVGSRELQPLEMVRELVRRLPAGSIVVSGGARGVDSAAAEEAARRGLDVHIHFPDWKREGRQAGKNRNGRIVEDSDVVVAFWDGTSRGTADTIAKAKKAGKPIVVYNALEANVRLVCATGMVSIAAERLAGALLVDVAASAHLAIHGAGEADG